MEGYTRDELLIVKSTQHMAWEVVISAVEKGSSGWEHVWRDVM